ncbi:Copia protein [Vitis vinifera]|uniref:Copia protein n=1 Tax=Vitis vinifera TaxID=29760 RepID=A0A438FUY2_VITVI|nr:Copia protein [Vitis vinifera]
MVEPKENFVIFLTLFMHYFFLPKFLPHFGVKLVFMLFIAINRIPSAVIHNQTPLMSTTNLSLDLDSVVSLVMAKLKRGIGVMILSLIIDDELPHFEPGSPAPALPEDPPQDIPPRHSTRSVVGCKWIYKIKARLVAKGFTQEYGIDYEETFALVARISSVRALLAVVAAVNGIFFKWMLKNAFLNGDLSEEVYMQLLPGLSVESNKVCHLRRALYGLKQAPRAWFAKFSSTIFRLAYESIQACQMMEELLGQVKARILEVYKLEFQVETRAQTKG